MSFNIDPLETLSDAAFRAAILIQCSRGSAELSATPFAAGYGVGFLFQSDQSIMSELREAGIIPTIGLPSWLDINKRDDIDPNDLPF